MNVPRLLLFDEAGSTVDETRDVDLDPMWATARKGTGPLLDDSETYEVGGFDE